MRERIWDEKGDSFLTLDDLEIEIYRFLELLTNEALPNEEALCSSHNGSSSVKTREKFMVLGNHKYLKKKFILKSGFTSKFLARRWIEENLRKN